MKSSIYGNMNEIIKMQNQSNMNQNSQQKRQKSTRYTQGNKKPSNNINFYPQPLSQQKTQTNTRRVAESDTIKISLDQVNSNTFVRGSSNIGSMVTSSTNKDANAQLFGKSFKEKNNQRRKSSRLSKGSRDKSHEKGVYKSLAVNQDEGLNPLN
mmetsp:Transcript_28546/g.27514  ORF Transcript_28546/g.27514 Transcript_28546/m.27514 type:complete len:154 (+) Transcript_28546:619-1080(+)